MYSEHFLPDRVIDQGTAVLLEMGMRRIKACLSPAKMLESAHIIRRKKEAEG